MEHKYIELIKKMIPNEQIYLNEPMKKHTSIRIGGPAEVFIKTKTIEEIKNIVLFAKKNKIKLYVIGNGSNILVKDKGIEGIVIKNEMTDIRIKEYGDNIEVKAQCGATMGAIAYKLLQNAITGFEEFSGIPGTIGGAVRMNAGAHGKEMKDVVINTTYIDMNGNVNTITNEEQQFNYRSSIFEKEQYIILETQLKLKKGKKEEIKNKIEQYANWRKEHQPLNYPNAGSTFKRGKNFITAELIDKCGLKGYTIGGAQISTKHAGFIVNTGNATAKDVLDLIKYVKKQVYQKTGNNIELEIEVI